MRVVRYPVRFALHVRLERRAIAPPAHHRQFAGIAVRLPDLKVDEAVGVVHEMRAPPERGHELGRPRGRHAKPRHRHVHQTATRSRESDSAAATGSPCRQVTPSATATSGAGTGAAQHEPAAPRERPQLRGDRVELVRRDGRHHDHVRVDRVRGHVRGAGRRVRAQVDVPPATRAQREAEAHERQRVLLARRARKHRAVPRALVPPARERQQPGLDEPAREVLLRDGDLAARPALAEVVQVGEERVADRALEPVQAEQPVDQLVRPLLVELLECRAQLQRELERGARPGSPRRRRRRPSAGPRVRPRRWTSRSRASAAGGAPATRRARCRGGSHSPTGSDAARHSASPRRAARPG